MTALRLKTAAVIYGALVGVAVLFGFLRGNPDIFNHPEGIITPHFSLLARLAIGCVAGIAVGLAIVSATRYSVYRFKWARTLHSEFRGLFGPITSTDIFGYAAISAVAEELFFRGALQPFLGIVATSIIFGALHIAPRKKFLPWPIQALIMGFILGGLYRLTGDLTAPVMAHFTINYQNLHFINRYNPAPELPRSLQSSAIDTQHHTAQRRSN
jgi:uncharacterized protein